MFDKFILGTVQLGMDYGVNSTGKPDLTNSLEILKLAQHNNIHSLDTADLYGESQKIISKFDSKKQFKVYSKFLSNDLFKHKLESTLTELGINQLEGYSFHRLQDCLSFKDYKGVELAVKEKKMKYLGVSIYNEDDLEKVLNLPYIEIIQLPINLLDHAKRNSKRWDLLLNAKESKKIIHIRSIFLQGLFLKDRNAFPDKLKPLIPYLQGIDKIANESKMTIAQLALNYILSLPFCDGVVIGVDNEIQLKQNIDLFKNAQTSSSVLDLIHNISVREVELLNPGNWK